MAVFCGTHHMSTNHAIQIDGDRANTRSYLQAVHLTDPDDNTQHHDVGGWYDNELVRTPDGWRFTRVELSFVWTAGAPWPTAPPRRSVSAEDTTSEDVPREVQQRGTDRQDQRDAGRPDRKTDSEHDHVFENDRERDGDRAEGGQGIES
jgi:hypothetical protein